MSPSDCVIVLEDQNTEQGIKSSSDRISLPTPILASRSFRSEGEIRIFVMSGFTDLSAVPVTDEIADCSGLQNSVRVTTLFSVHVHLTPPLPDIPQTDRSLF